MIIDRAKLTIQFEVQYDKKWVGLEATLTEADDPIKSLNKLQQLVESYHASANRSPDPSVLPVIQVNEERNIGISTDAIFSCNDLKSLEIYKGLIKGNDYLIKAYNQRHKELCDMLV